MSEQHTTDVTDAITPDNPNTVKKIQKYTAVVAAAATGAYVVFTAVQKFAERKRVTVTVADQPDN